MIVSRLSFAGDSRLNIVNMNELIHNVRGSEISSRGCVISDVCVIKVGWIRTVNS